MIKCVCDIGEDGSGLGKHFAVEEECYDRLVNGLDSIELDILTYTEHSGEVFFIEEGLDEDTWRGVLKESEGYATIVSYETLKEAVMSVISEYKNDDELMEDVNRI